MVVGCLTYALALAAVITAFFSPALAWGLLLLPVGVILFFWLSVRMEKARPLAEVSPDANELLRKFGHYYYHPSAGTEFSSSASAVGMSSIAVATIGLFRGFWWGLPFAILVYFLTGLLARQFNPTHFLTDDRERAAHEEIIAALQSPKFPFREAQD